MLSLMGWDMSSAARTNTAYEYFYHAFILGIGAIFMLTLASTLNILFNWCPLLTETAWVFLVTAVLTVLCWLRDISVLARISFIAVASCFVVIVVIFLDTLVSTPGADGRVAGTERTD